MRGERSPSCQINVALPEGFETTDPFEMSGDFGMSAQSQVQPIAGQDVKLSKSTVHGKLAQFEFGPASRVRGGAGLDWQTDGVGI